MGMVFRHALVLAGVASAIGLGLGLAGSNLLAGMLFGVTPVDPLTFATVPLLLVAVAAVATWLPAP